MKIGIISDTHGDIVQVEKALDILGDCQHIVHCGDVLYHGPRNELPENYNPKKLAELLSSKDNIVYIRGNCDSDVDEMVIKKDLKAKNRLLNFEKYKVYAVHGYEETEDNRIEKALELGANIVVSGHTHIKVLKEKDGIVVINPGSTTIPKDGSSSVCLIEDDNIKLISLENNEIIKEISIKQCSSY